jgi:hypothetical protein
MLTLGVFEELDKLPVVMMLTTAHEKLPLPIFLLPIVRMLAIPASVLRRFG